MEGEGESARVPPPLPHSPLSDTPLTCRTHATRWFYRLIRCRGERGVGARLPSPRDSLGNLPVVPPGSPVYDGCYAGSPPQGPVGNRSIHQSRGGDRAVRREVECSSIPRKEKLNPAYTPAAVPFLFAPLRTVPPLGVFTSFPLHCHCVPTHGGTLDFSYAWSCL